MTEHPYLNFVRADHAFTRNCRLVMVGRMTAYENGTSAECFEFMAQLSEMAWRGFETECKTDKFLRMQK